MIQTFAWARPWSLVLLLLVPAWLFWRHRQLGAAVLPFAPLQLGRDSADDGRARAVSLLSTVTEALLFTALITGFAGPHRETRLELIDDPGIDIVLALDVSLSMLAEDLEPNRLEALRRIAKDFVVRSGGNRLGVLVFAGDPFVHTPLTRDHRSLLELLEDVTVYTLDQAQSGGTAIGDALLVAAQRLAESKVEGRDQVLILITDGENNEGLEPTLASRWAAEQGIRVHAVGVGDTEPIRVFFEGRPVGTQGSYIAALDDQQLEAIAESGGGLSFRATDVGALEQIFADLSRLESAPLESRTVAVRASFSSWLSLAALGLLAGRLWFSGVTLRRPWR